MKVKPLTLSGLLKGASAAMATGDPVKELREELACPICLEFFKKPVSIACGHNFCQSCLDQYRKEKEASCPQCRKEVLKEDIRPNWQLMNLVKIAKKLRSQKREEKGRVCQKHQEPLKLFCKDHESSICVVCDKSKEHEKHKVIPLDESLQEYKDRIWNLLKSLKKEREEILAYKADTAQESQDLLEITHREKEKAVAAFRHMHQFLEEQERNLLAKMEEVEKEISAKGEEHLARLSEELSSLSKLIQEMEEKHQQPASELLQVRPKLTTGVAGTVTPQLSDGSGYTDFVSCIILLNMFGFVKDNVMG
uniref:Uncharacterized protein n=1 Tax=Anolis carolinensis TaxID=28377 RepID=A0A803TR50_ANOCA